MGKYVKWVVAILIFLALLVATLIFAIPPSVQVEEPAKEERPTVYDRPATTVPDHIIIENALP